MEEEPPKVKTKSKKMKKEPKPPKPPKEPKEPKIKKESVKKEEHYIIKILYYKDFPESERHIFTIDFDDEDIII